VTSNYAYDAIYQLMQVTQRANTTESYSYDPVGNRLSSLGASPYAYNVSNQLTAKPGASYTYDDNGNTVSKTDASGATAYAWDYENRLTSVTLPGTGGTVTFKYDPFGRRIYKASASGTSIFAYDGDNLVEETNSSGAVVARYSQGLNIDEPLAMLRGAATSYYHADGLGSVTSLSNAAGALAQTYTYDSFGKLTTSAGSLTNPFQYTARESDAETGLYYYRARYYDQAVGRFLSEDPIGLNGGLNLYWYSNNDPTYLRDPMGTSPQGALDTLLDLGSWLRGTRQKINHVEDAATSDLSRTPGMQDIRDQYRLKGCSYSGFLCNDYQYRKLVSTTNLEGQVVGSFCVRFLPIGNNRVLVSAQNTWGLASGTRLPKLGAENRSHPSLADMLLRRAPLQYPSSLLNDKASGALRNLTVHYYWMEKSPCCGQ